MKKINIIASLVLIAGISVVSCQKPVQQNQQNQEKTEEKSAENTPKVEAKTEVKTEVKTDVKEEKSTQNQAENTPKTAKIGLEIGDFAPDFSLPDTKGTLTTLAQFRGKTTLIDFWAAWCGPCRRENPNVVAVYQKYKDKGFQVLGVSLDNDKAKWVEAIAKDNLAWAQVDRKSVV